MFDKTAQYYDLIYAEKDYAGEVEKLVALIQQEAPGAKTLLDAACGTGEHARFLAKHFQVSGVDLNPDLVGIARAKVPQAHFEVADMSDFDLGQIFDVITCLFSAIGYLTEPDKVIQALKCFKSHLSPNGVILIEPWITPEQWKVGGPYLSVVDLPELKICRMNMSELNGRRSDVHFEYLIGTPRGVERATETHELMLYTIGEMLGFFEEAGLFVRHDPSGITGRGLYIAKHG